MEQIVNNLKLKELIKNLIVFKNALMKYKTVLVLLFLIKQFGVERWDMLDNLILTKNYNIE